MLKRTLQILTALAALALPAGDAQAYIHSIPASLAQDALSESVPTAFAPVDFTPEDFSFEWVGEPLHEVSLSLVPDTIEWVRVGEFISLPRSRLQVVARDAQAGKVTVSGFSQALAESNEASIRAQIPIALQSGERNPVEITILREGKEILGKAVVRFTPKDNGVSTRILYDSSCSPYGLSATVSGATSAAKTGHDWMYVGCRLVTEAGPGNRTGSLELYTYWDNVGDVIQVGGVSTPSTSPSLWPLRVRAKPGRTELSANGRKIKLSYYAPDAFKHFFIGAGLGPYEYKFFGGGRDTVGVAPVLTIYASLFITESIRLVAFDATAISRSYYTDLGVYLSTESAKILDNRLSVNLLLGGHVIWFESEGKGVQRFGAPQGFEFNFRDAFVRGYNFGAGAFIYPLINDKAYSNVWLRWGTRGYFGEVNYIGWKERAEDRQIYSRSFGVCFGVPIGRFF